MRDKLRERRLARAVKAKGLKLLRARGWIRPSAHSGTYALADLATNSLLLADPETGYGVTLDEVEQFVGELEKVRERRESASAQLA